ncbi:MAG: sigma-70 family RNA polymerase sigma factor [Acidimicrobiales bacterium]
MSIDQCGPALDPTRSAIDDLLRECSACDLPTAFSVAYRRHSGAVHGLARRTCGDKSADDVTSEVFLRLWTHPEKFDASRGSLRSFLLTIGRHIAIDVIRSESSRRAREDRSGSGSDASPIEVDHELLQDEWSAHVAEALNDLPIREREAIATAFYGQCTYKEAALVLGEPEGTIKSRIRAGLSRLRIAPAALSDLSAAG